MKKLIIFLVFTYLFIAFTIDAKESKEGDIIFITGKDSSINQISKADMKKFFLGKKRSFGKDKNVILVINTEKNAAKSFYKFIGKSKSNYEKYWEKLIYTGKANEPIKFTKSDQIINFIKENPKSISYITKKDTLNCKKIKIIKIIK